MEQINLYNYEAFFLDYLEGNLSEGAEASLHSFLAAHPDLLNEFNTLLADSNIDEVTLAAPIAQFDKQFLKVDETVISPLTIDDWMVSKVEGLLNLNETNALSAYISANGLEKKMAYYENTVLVPESEGYGNKRDLKRKDGLVIPFYVRLSAAAAVGIVLVGLFYNQNTNESGLAAELDTVNPINNRIDVKGGLSASVISKYSDGINLPSTKNEDNNESVKTNLVVQKEVQLPEEQDSVILRPKVVIEEDNISQHPPLQDSLPIFVPDKIKDVVEEYEDVAVVIPKSSVVEEEPFRLITNAAGNLMNRDIRYVRDRNTETDQYVAHHFKLGIFEFERKKSK